MKRRISIILLLIATLMFSLLAFTACSKDNPTNLPDAPLDGPSDDKPNIIK